MEAPLAPQAKAACEDLDEVGPASLRRRERAGAGGGPKGVGPLQLPDLVEQDADGLGHAVEDVLGQNLVEGGGLVVAGHRRWSPLAGSAPFRGTGGGRPLQAECPPRRGRESPETAVHDRVGV